MSITDEELGMLIQTHHYLEVYVEERKDTVGHPTAEKNLEDFEAYISKLGAF